MAEEPVVPDGYEDLLQRLHNNEKIAVDAHTALKMAEKYMEGVFSGYGKTFAEIAYNTPDYDMLASLEHDVYQFSAAKNYKMLRELTSLLKEGERIRTFSEFRREAAKTLDTWVGSWMKTEYETAVASAQMAGRWAYFESTAEDITLLKFIIAPGENVCPICMHYNGIVKPKGHPFWRYAYPLLHFNCHCDVIEVLHEVVTPDEHTPGDEYIPAMFRTNLGQQGMIFPPGHPYYDGTPKRVINKFVKNNLPDRDAND